MELFNEAFKEKQKLEEGLMKKWESALNADGGIKDEHMARTTAILLENYMTYLKKDPSLIAEDRIASTDFKGVNMALLGLIRRAIPALVGTELVGIQAMPTPSSPLFYMSWRKSMGPNGTSKGASVNDQEFFGYPGAPGVVGGSYDQMSSDIDPYFTSSQIRNQLVTDSPVVSTTYNVDTPWAPIVNRTLKVFALDSNNAVVGTGWFNSNTPVNALGTPVPGQGAIASVNITTTSPGSFTSPRIIVVTAGSLAGAVKIVAAWEYNQESNVQSPEVGVNIDEFNVKLIRRMLRGKFSLDSITDAKAYHGISIENELMEIMKYELMNEINREIITDLRSMAQTSAVADYAAAAANNTIGNYDDSFKYALDKINGLCAEILNQTRAGRGNFVVGNPATLSFLDRVPGFVGAGVSYDGKGLSFAGQLGKRINFYVDPQYPKNELLIGYKGSSALDTGYIHAPYLPITTTPTLYNPETGDPSKIFYTRYGKTYRDIDTETGVPYNAIFRGGYFYSRLFLQNWPSI